MNGVNNIQRLGEDFLKEIETIIKTIEINQGIKVSIRQVTNLMTVHSEFNTIKQDTIDYDFKQIKEKWRF